MPYILIYKISLFFSLLDLFKINKFYRKKLNHILLLAIIIFLGFRGYVGHDWYHYKPNFENIENIFEVLQGNYVFFTKLHYDLGFKIYMSFIKMFSSDYHFFVFVSSLLDVVLLYIVFNKNTKYVMFSFLAFICFDGLTIGFDLMRNIKSILVFLYSLEYIKNKQIIKFYMACLISILFHWSAIFYLPMYFILNKRFNKRKVMKVFIALNLYYLIGSNLIRNLIVLSSPILPQVIVIKLTNYLNVGFYNSNNHITLGYIEKVVFFIAIYYLNDNILKISKNNKIFINSLYIYIFSYLIFYDFIVIQQRLGILYIYSYWFIYPIIFQAIAKKFNIKKQLKIILLLLLSLYPFVRLLKGYVFVEDKILAPNYKYENILINSTNLNERINDMRKLRTKIGSTVK